MFPPPRLSLVRVDTLSLAQIGWYLATYSGLCANHTTGTIVLPVDEGNKEKGKHKKQASKVLKLPELDKRYYLVDLLDAKKYTLRQVRGLLGWIQLRSSKASPIVEHIKRNKESIVIDTFERARTFLIKNGSRLLFSSNEEPKTCEERAMEVIEACMRMLCDLQGVGVKEASAVVAAWHPAGIYMSDELVKNLFGEKQQLMEDWAFFRRFYKEAVKALKGMYAKGRITSGREMEKVAWSMYYASIEPPESSDSEESVTSEKEPEHEQNCDQGYEESNGHQKDCQEQGLAKKQDENQVKDKDKDLARDKARDADKNPGQGRESVEGEKEALDSSPPSHAAPSTGSKTNNQTANSQIAALSSSVEEMQGQRVELNPPTVAQAPVIEEIRTNTTPSDLANPAPSMVNEAGEASAGSSSKLTFAQPTDEVDSSARVSSPSIPQPAASEPRKARKQTTKSKGSGSKSRSRHSSNINVTIQVLNGSAPPNVYINVPSADSVSRDKKRKRSKGKAKETAGEGGQEVESSRKRSRRNNGPQEPGPSSRA